MTINAMKILGEISYNIKFIMNCETVDVRFATYLDQKLTVGLAVVVP